MKNKKIHQTNKRHCGQQEQQQQAAVTLFEKKKFICGEKYSTLRQVL